MTGIRAYRHSVRHWVTGTAFCVLTSVISACSDPASIDTSTPNEASAPDTTVYVNADVLTMDDSVQAAEALAVRDGKILAVGHVSAVLEAAGANAAIEDLSGKTIMPSFIDAHGHIMIGTVTAGMADLQPPPAGAVTNMAELTETLTAWRATNPDAPWIMGFGYDDSLLAENRHPTREELDKISTDIPVMLLHVSAHLMTCNSACLDIAGINADTPNPPGGVIQRKMGSHEPNGVLEEGAMHAVFAKFPAPSPQQTMAAVQTIQNTYARMGITTAQEGAGNPQQLGGLKQLAAAGALKMDIVGYKAIHSADDFTPELKTEQSYINGYRTGGIKLILDGSPQGKTAWLTHPYHVVPNGQTADYAGYATMESPLVNTLLSDAFSRDIHVIAHANGDAAADQLLSGIKAANEAHGKKDRRPVMIHAQTARDDQIMDMKTEGVIPSYFVAHTFFWGDWHRDSVLGEKRAARISPLGTSLKHDLTFTIHNDSPVIPPDMMRLVWTAVNRKTRSGKILGPDERISPMDALKAVTIDAAYQYFEEADKGSITPGKRADLVILSANPVTVAPETIKDIQILETLKDGKTIYAKD